MPSYQANITAGSLRVPESRVIADLLLKGVNEDDFRQAVIDENILQARNPATAKRVARLIRQRLDTMDVELWQLVRDGSLLVAKHATMAAAIKHSRLLGDFLDLVVKEQNRIYDPYLTKAVWNRYLDDCRSRDPDMPAWNESTCIKLRRVVFQILVEAGYLDSTRSLRLQPVHVAPPVMRYLEAHEENYVLRCLQGE